MKRIICSTVFYYDANTKGSVICYEKLTVKHDFSSSLFTDHHIRGAIRHRAFLSGITLVQTSRMDLQHIRRPQNQVEALVTGQTSSIVHQDDVVSDAAVAGAPNRDGVGENGQS